MNTPVNNSVQQFLLETEKKKEELLIKALKNAGLEIDLKEEVLK